MKNAFRNLIRTLSVTLILALSIGLALIMLLSYQTVEQRIASVKASTGTTITLNPAGSQGFQGGGEPLSEDQINTVKGLSHVTAVNANLQGRLTTDDNTNLASAIDPGTLGNRAGQQDQRRFQRGAGQIPPGGAQGLTQNFSLPITATGVSNMDSVLTGSTSLTSGSAFQGNSEDKVAVVGTALATKNNLTVGSTFTAYGQEMKVAGIFDAGNQFANSSLYLPIKTLQALAEQPGEISAATVTVDTIENVEGTESAIKNALGSDKVDVTSNLQAAEQAIAPLENIKRISLFSLIGALVAGAIITLLIMMMIVRERRREIGVLKAIGASNIGVVTQFVSEALVLTGLGSVVGIIIGFAFSNPVLDALVTNSTANATQQATGPMGDPGGRFMRLGQLGGQVGGGVQSAVRDLQATIGLDIVLYGLLAAIAVAIIGSAIPAWLIAKVKPAEVMRAE